MLEGLGEPKKTFDADEYVVKKKAISPFDFANSICYSKENIMVDEWSEKQYSPFIVNKHLSYGSDTVTAANEMNARPHIDHSHTLSSSPTVFTKVTSIKTAFYKRSLEILRISEADECFHWTIVCSQITLLPEKEKRSQQDGEESDFDPT